MNSYCGSLYQKNITQFQNRFPSLYDMLKDDIKTFEEDEKTVSKLPFNVVESKNGSATADINGVMLHSKYNPEREAEQLISRFGAENGSPHKAAVFFSCGLGYAPLAFHKKNPDIPVIIIEENPLFLLQAFTVLDWTPLFSHVQIVFAVAAPVQSAGTILRQYDVDSLCIFSVPSQCAHSESYFKELKAVLVQEKQKQETNTNTLEKFGHLWLSNSLKNMSFLDRLDGVDKYRMVNRDLQIPFVVLAAGPSLERLLPHLAVLKKKAILVCVDTAVHSCLNAGVEPDFIVLLDPQYACALHLEFLSSPSSVLITECAAWPSVFRFECSEIVLCSSLYPPGQYFEKLLGTKGKLAAGGSVATSCWDFARICGTQKIYIAGMDLGFPGRQTHIRGSQFEERAHRLSDRLKTCETQSVASLMGAAPFMAHDYNGKPILSDKKMSLFSWWFEKSCAVAEEEGVSTYSLTPESMAVKGIEKSDFEEFLKVFPDCQDKKAEFFEKAKHKSWLCKEENENRASYDEVCRTFRENMEVLISTSRKGISLCEKAIRNRAKVQEVFAELSKIDSTIMTSGAKDAAALVFPTERRLKELSENIPQDKILNSLYTSRIIYNELQKAAREYLDNLP